MYDDQRRAAIWARIAAIRDELEELLAELGAEAGRSKRPFTIIQGGLGALVLPVLWLARRPRAASALTASAGLGLTAVVTAIAVPAPLGRQAVAPTPVITVIGTALATTVAATVTVTAASSAPTPSAVPAIPVYTATPGVAGSSTAVPSPSSSSTATASPSSSSSPTTTATPSSPGLTPPASCLVSVGVNGVIDVCLL